MEGFGALVIESGTPRMDTGHFSPELLAIPPNKDQKMLFHNFQPDLIFVNNFTPPEFHTKNFTPQKYVICNIVHARYKSVNAFDISNFGFFVRIELNFTVFEKKKHKLMI